jgi:hypothetical protein
MFKQLKLVIGVAVTSTLVACGGGGDSAEESGSGSLSTTNPKAALSELFTQTTQSTSWRSTSSIPNGYQATILAYSSGEALYGKQNFLKGPNKVVTLQLQIRDSATTVLIAKFLYQIYIDKVSGNVIGAADTYNDNAVTAPCINSDTQISVPLNARTGDSGFLIDGLANYYQATNRAGVYAHYCQTVLGEPSPVSANVKWSFQNDSGKDYICLTNVVVGTLGPLTRICIGVDSQGKLNQSMMAFVYDKSAVLYSAKN